MAWVLPCPEHAYQRSSPRASKHLLYFHIGLLVVMTACSVTIWVMMRRTHIEMLVLSHTWAQTNHQLIRASNINRLLLHAHVTQDEDTVREIVMHVDRDVGKFEEAHRNLKQDEPFYTADICASIDSWLSQVRDAIQQRSVPYEFAVAHNVQDALLMLMTAYHDRMKNSINYCSGILSLVLVTTMLVVALTVLVSRRILACSGHEVRIFIDGHQLLEQFHGADVIVSDVNMPGAITGMELAARVRAAGYHGGMIADTSDSSTHELCIASGFVAVMANPTPAPFHIVTIESVHNRRELRLGVGQQADDVDTANSPNLTRYTETQGGDINRTVQ